MSKQTVALGCLVLALVVAPVAFAGPTVTTADYAWLAGRWEGKVPAFPGSAEVEFQPPTAGLITGVMKLVTDTHEVVVVELISMVDTPLGLELRFRHFSPTLQAYEADFQQNLRLTAHEAGVDTFTNLVEYKKELTSTQPRVTKYIRKSTNEFVGHSDIIGDDGKPAVVESIYHRVR